MKISTNAAVITIMSMLKAMSAAVGTNTRMDMNVVAIMMITAHAVTIMSNLLLP